MNAVVRLRKMYELLSGLPGGMKLFSLAVGRAAPYTGTIGAEILELRPGYCRVRLRDRHAVRNHLSSIHAVALMNLGEVATGLAFMIGLPENARGIVTGLSIEYHKKARGTLVAECTTAPAADNERREYEVPGVIRDSQGDTVATVKAKWMVGPST